MQAVESAGHKSDGDDRTRLESESAEIEKEM